MNTHLIIYYIKYPTPGRVKTRLAKTVGDQEAARIYQHLAEQNFLILKNYKDAQLVIFFDPPEDKSKVQFWLTGAKDYIPQQGLGLGERLKDSFTWAFMSGYKRVIVFGSDTLNLTTTIVDQGFEALLAKDIVIGPAKDGGYYLIGLSSYQSLIFDNISWSTNEVLPQTYKIIKTLNLKSHTLSMLEDLDEMTPS